MQIDRRTLMKAAGSLAFLGGFAPTPLFAQPLGANPFTLGIASGDPWPDGFVIWTRLAPKPLEEHGGMPMVTVPVGWEVAEDDRFSRIVRKGEAFARPELGHSVHVEVEGLKPRRPYWYRFSVAGSDMSPVGTVRTAPAPGDTPERLRIGVGGCQHYEHGYFGAWAHMAQEPDLDLIFHYGDYIYEGRPLPLGPRADGREIVRQHVGDEIYSIDDYRRRHAQYKSDADLQAAHAACAFAVSFDDHEVDNNWAGDIDQDGTNPEVFVLRRMGALQAWYENMPVRRAQFPTPHGLKAYRRLDYGRLLRMHVLDTRSYRSDQPCDDGKMKSCPPEAHNAPTMLGGVQEAWLDDGLASGATWNLLAQQVLVMPLDRREVSEPAFATDCWDGYRPARARLIESIRRRELTNVVIASGDYHRNFAGTLPSRPDAPDGEMAAVEFLATSISSFNGAPYADREVLYVNNPHVKLINDQRGYHVFDITPKEWTTDIKVMDRTSQPGGNISTLARFAVTPDAPVLHEA